MTAPHIVDPHGLLGEAPADSEAAFQEVFHVHLHVFPRAPGDGFRIDADRRQRPRAELDNAAERIRNSMASSSS